MSYSFVKLSVVSSRLNISSLEGSCCEITSVFGQRRTNTDVLILLDKLMSSRYGETSRISNGVLFNPRILPLNLHIDYPHSSWAHTVGTCGPNPYFAT